MIPFAIVLCGLLGACGIYMIGRSLQSAKERGMRIGGFWASASDLTHREHRFNRFGFAISLLSILGSALVFAYIKSAG